MLKFGFFDSVNGDRKYNAREVSEMFDGIILDGVFMYVGEHFQVDPKEGSDMEITVGTGQAWLNHTKVLNTRKIPFEISPATVRGRIDAVIVEVNEKERTGDIFLYEDYYDSELINDEFVHQYVVALITVPLGVSKIGVAHIDNRVGVTLPFVKGPNEYLDPDYIMRHWEAIWNTFYEKCAKEWNDFYGEATEDWKTFYHNATENWSKFYDETLSTWETFYNQASEEVDALLEKANLFTDNAEEAAKKAENSARRVEEMANTSQSYAVGGTETREGEDTDNSKFYSERAKDCRDESVDMLDTAQGTLDEIIKKLGIAVFTIDDEGNLCYDDDSEYNFAVDDDGDLTWEVAV